jgi:DegV family protein with EDD domain
MEHRNIAVVTDSTAYIPPEALGELDIPVIPVWLLWDGDTFRDGIDIDPPTFYRRLRGSKSFPTTSQPSAGEFDTFFRQVAAQADAIVGVFVSARLSGTVANALAAAENLPELTIRVIDSRATSMAQGFIALAAARAAAAGKPLDEVVAAAETTRERVHMLFAVDTLEFLHRGGRIGNAKWLLGTALNIKPLLQFADGTIESLAQVRTKRKAVARMLDEVAARLNGNRIAEAAIVDMDSSMEGDVLAAQVEARFGIPTVYRSTVSPAIGVHAGPGTVAICFYADGTPG